MEFSDRPESPRNKEDRISLLILGDQGVGKTSMVNMYTKNEERLSYIPTVGLDCAHTKHEFSDG